MSSFDIRRDVWMQDAACRGLGAATMHPDKGQHARTRMAKAMCEDCPVKQECLDMALNDSSLQGIWGGTSEIMRIRIRRQIRKAAA